MWKKLLKKLAQNVFLKKAKLWLKEAGLVNVGWIIVGVVTFIFGGIPLGMIGMTFIKPYIVGVCVGIFAHLNWALVIKLWKTKIRKKIDDTYDDVKDKI